MTKPIKRLHETQYPKIIQILSAPNMWNAYRDFNTGKLFYSRVTCLALVEHEDIVNGKYQELQYIDMDDAWVYDLTSTPCAPHCNLEHTIYSETDPNEDTDIMAGVI